LTRVIGDVENLKIFNSVGTRTHDQTHDRRCPCQFNHRGWLSLLYYFYEVWYNWTSSAGTYGLFAEPDTTYNYLGSESENRVTGLTLAINTLHYWRRLEKLPMIIESSRNVAMFTVATGEHDDPRRKQRTRNTCLQPELQRQTDCSGSGWGQHPPPQPRYIPIEGYSQAQYIMTSLRQ